MTRLIFTLLLSALPLWGHCYEQPDLFGLDDKNIYGKVSCYTHGVGPCCALIDFYAHGFEPGTEFDLQLKRSNQRERSLGKFVVNEEGWLDRKGNLGWARILASGLVGEGFCYEFTGPDGRGYTFNTAPFPLCFKDRSGHLAALYYLDSMRTEWVVEYVGYEKGEVISTELSAYRRKLELPKQEVRVPCVEILRPNFTNKDSGKCIATVRSHTKGSKFSFKFDWGYQYLEEPTLKWLKRQQKNDLLLAELRAIDDLPERKQEGLVASLVQSTTSIAYSEDGYSIERPITSDYRKDKYAKVVVTVPPGYKPLQPLDACIVEFIPDSDKDPARWSEVLSVLYYTEEIPTAEWLMDYTIERMSGEQKAKVLFKETLQDEDLNCASCLLLYTHQGRREILAKRVIFGEEGGCALHYAIPVDPSMDIKTQAQKAYQKLGELVSVVKT